MTTHHLQARAAEQPLLRVGLHYGSGCKGSYTLTCSAGFKEISGTSITVTATSSRVIFSSVGGTVSDDYAMPLTPYGVATIEGKSYRGSFLFTTTSDGLSAVNLVWLEEYLQSVVPSEMPSHWPAEALKTQAVCARTYAMRNINKHKSDGFDLCAGVHCQAYNGVSQEKQGVTDAIGWTRGQIVIYRTQPIDVYYFSTSGGFTEDVGDVWGGDLPYLTSVDDSYENPLSPHYTWTRTYTAAELSAKLKARGVDVGTVTDVEILSTTPNGAVTSLRVTGTGGTKTYTKEGCRTFLGGENGMLSQSYIVRRGSGGVASSTSGLLDMSHLYIKSADGMTAFTKDTLHTLGDKPGTLSTKMTYDGLFRFYGRGFGHLVGMSQYGAKGMADAGFKYHEILPHYYRNTELLQAYE